LSTTKEQSTNIICVGKRSFIWLNVSSPKTAPTDNVQKDPDDWVSGEDPMTGAQPSYLRTLCEQAETPGLFDESLSKAQASKMIDEMRDKAGLAKNS
jgi:hypothetical protein